MILETKRLMLRDFTMDDLDDLHEILGNDETMLFTERAYSKEKTATFLQSFCIDRQPKGAYAAVLKSTGKLIGYVLFKPLGEEDVYEIGWIFNNLFWRQGYAYEVCSKLIEYGFTEMKLHKICAEAIDTVKSVSLMIKLGMIEEGVQRKHARHPVDGTWCDLHWYAILKEEYIATR